MTAETTNEMVLHPMTGELLELAHAQTDDLGRFLADVRDYESRLKEAKSLVSREVLRRQDMAATWTTHTDGYTLKGSSPAAGEEWDELALRESLWELVDQGVISEEAAGAAVETVVTYKVRASGVGALRKLGGRVAETVNQHATPVEKTRYVTVSLH
jgi:hypothetical protein